MSKRIYGSFNFSVKNIENNSLIYIPAVFNPIPGLQYIEGQLKTGRNQLSFRQNANTVVGVKTKSEKSFP